MLAEFFVLAENFLLAANFLLANFFVLAGNFVLAENFLLAANFLQQKGSLTVWALYAYFSDSQNAAFELLVWCMEYQCNR